MFLGIKNKIQNSKLSKIPYPYLAINNFLPKKYLNSLNKILPSYDELQGDGLLYQSTSKTKKSIFPNSKQFKKLNKKKIFKDLNLLFKKLESTLIKKFEKEINTFTTINAKKIKLNYHFSYSVMKKGYLKSSHIDRRDHLIHGILYPYSDQYKGGDILINEFKKKKKYFDVFPKKQDLKTKKKFKVKNNFCIFILNVPWAYHSVTKYMSKKDRKYFYVAYDFKIPKKGSITKNRKKGFNANTFWKNKAALISKNRRKIFLSE